MSTPWDSLDETLNEFNKRTDEQEMRAKVERMAALAWDHIRKIGRNRISDVALKDYTEWTEADSFLIKGVLFTVAGKLAMEEADES